LRVSVDSGGSGERGHIHADRTPTSQHRHTSTALTRCRSGGNGGEDARLIHLPVGLSRSQGGDIAVPPSRVEMVRIARSRSGTQPSPFPTCSDDVCHGSERGWALRTRAAAACPASMAARSWPTSNESAAHGNILLSRSDPWVLALEEVRLPPDRLRCRSESRLLQEGMGGEGGSAWLVVLVGWLVVLVGWLVVGRWSASTCTRLT